MRLIAVFSLLFAAASFPTREVLSWHEWKRAHTVSYEDPEEDMRRRAIYRANVEIIIAHNSNREKSYTMGVNRFSALSPAEFANLFRLMPPAPPSERHIAYLEPAVAGTSDAIDWRTKGAVTPVKDQGGCG